MGKTQNSHRRIQVLENVIKPEAEIVKKSVCSYIFLLSAVKVLGLVIFYYTFSISLTFYNQRFIKIFRFPLSITVTHLVFKYCCASLIRSFLECKTKEPRICLQWGVYLKKVAPAGIVSALDIGLSNWSFEFITVSLYTMSKSSAVIFILGFSLLFRLEKMRWSLVFVVLFIAGGLFMFTYHSTQFNLEGFILVISASFLSGMRWTLAQIVTQKQEIGLQNPLDMMYHIQPWMILGLLPLSAAVEGLEVSTTNKLFRYEDVSVLMTNIGLLLLGASLAFLLEFSEFLLLSQTSSLTLSITGIFKEICTLYLASQFNGDTMNAVNAIGLVVCLFGIMLHVIIKAVNRKESTEKALEMTELEMEMLIKDGEANASPDEDADEIDVFNVKRDR